MQILTKYRKTAHSSLISGVELLWLKGPVETEEKENITEIQAWSCLLRQDNSL